MQKLVRLAESPLTSIDGHTVSSGHIIVVTAGVWQGPVLSLQCELAERVIAHENTRITDEP